MQQSTQTLRQISPLDEIVDFFDTNGIDASKYIVNGEINIEKLVEGIKYASSSSEVEVNQIFNFFNKKRASLQK